jgi:hypothetical protein
MPEECTTLDLVELARGQLDAVNRRDLDALLVNNDIDEGRAAADRLAESRG